MRHSDFKQLNKQFTDRWSPRAFSSEKINTDDLMTLFEAARWSPSCFNAQPWHFVYACNDDDLARFRSVLNEKNNMWASKAPVLFIVFSRKHFTHNDSPNRWADFDTGAAWMALSLQAQKLGIYTHAMGGFDQEKAFAECGVDATQFNAVCVIAAGKIADADSLPEEFRDREKASPRNPLDAIVSEGKMG